MIVLVAWSPCECALLQVCTRPDMTRTKNSNNQYVHICICAYFYKAGRTVYFIWSDMRLSIQLYIYAIYMVYSHVICPHTCLATCSPTLVLLAGKNWVPSLLNQFYHLRPHQISPKYTFLIQTSPERWTSHHSNCPSVSCKHTSCVQKPDRMAE